MKIAMINTYSTGSTGSIARYIGELASKNGNIVRYFYGRNKMKSDWGFIGENKLCLYYSNFMTLLTGDVGSYHVLSTKKLLKELTAFEPDVIHLHNIHGNYLNFKMLFDYLSKFEGKVVITMHDEFLLTGRCALCECEKWKTGCNKCDNLNAYPRAWTDHSSNLHYSKIQMLKNVNNLVLVTPSKWLESYVKQSLIKSIVCRCIHNGIEEPQEEIFDLKNLIEKDKINILFAAYTWTVDKGANVINELCQKIDKNKYNIIVAGVEEYCLDLFTTNCKTIGLLSKEKLFHLLKNVDLFANPTFKDNLPTILIEALSAGTPSITFNTGGCCEIIDDTCGVVLDDKTSDGLKNAIECFDFHKATKENCIIKSKCFSSYRMANEYLDIYKEGF